MTFFAQHRVHWLALLFKIRANVTFWERLTDYSTLLLKILSPSDASTPFGHAFVEMESSLRCGGHGELKRTREYPVCAFACAFRRLTRDAER